MTAREAAFWDAIRAPELPVPEGCVGPNGAPAARRFDVYRNNVVVGLTEALADAFPSVVGHLGRRFFDALAGVFVRAHPPAGPVLSEWGDDFPLFLEGFGPVARWPWLADVARVENAVRASYHAADATPLGPEALAGVGSEDPAALRVALAPSVRWVASRYPVHDLWRIGLGGPKPDLPPSPQGVLIARPVFDPQARRVEGAEMAWWAALWEGAALGAAWDSALAVDQGWEPGAALAWCVAQGGVVGLGKEGERDGLA